MTAGPLFLYLEASMKAPLKRKGNPPATSASHAAHRSLNESPSEKEGKSVAALQFFKGEAASMKAPPRRKGNFRTRLQVFLICWGLNESPSKKEGKCSRPIPSRAACQTLNESPSQKEGKFRGIGRRATVLRPSMKALPRRKGNGSHLFLGDHAETLNESPSQKEGK